MDAGGHRTTVARVSEFLRCDCLRRCDRDGQSDNAVRLARHRRKLAKVFAVPLSREAAELEIGAVAKPTPLTGATDVLHNVLRSGL